MIPQQCIDFIITEETGGQAYYTKFACHPVWPGGASGITIGVGYDLGQNTLADLKATWGDLLDAATIQQLGTAVGIVGSPANQAKLQALVAQLKGITIPFADVVQVFTTKSLPVYEAKTLAAFPGLDKLNGLCIGAMVSLVYNRGTVLTGPTRTEMQAIRDLIAQGKPEGVPAQFTSMKRLWPNAPGLQKRRDAESQMFQQGLNAMAAAPVA
ncbi:hypothetical protein HHL28_08530 [Aerophototrophica crusticola]|uniref:Pesticin C-terminal domain-containing protein n=1 Tax=Aerophototrophica crusticola TaxID=1709002 RepID=A0A858R787_9PROT|nr:hypothetical protein HHL28_08530 [Rhodospirillaceae bacterium B3]